MPARPKLAASAAKEVRFPSFDELAADAAERSPDQPYLLPLKNTTIEIDLDGARQVRETMPDALFVFLKPPSWEELVRRLVGRGTEDEVERERRLDTARTEMAAEAEFDVTIVNDEVRHAAEQLVSLMRTH